MTFRRQYIFALICWLPVSLLYTAHIPTQEFIVVIDAGHGGNDPGAIGKISKEKDINLKVALKLGNLIRNNSEDVKVIYTRNKDIFVSLDRRAEIANMAKADLFISIHTNALANNQTIKGASTWTLGLAKSETNLSVAKRENAVILYEEDYQTRYAGFDPNSSESYIIFELMQDKYMSQSVHFASIVQQHFKTTCRRIDRGVHQAGFLVLKASAMPSVLVELGFISSPEEERYMNSEKGVDNLSNGIYCAFLQYKEEHQTRLTSAGGYSESPAQPEPVVETTPPAADDKIIFKVQILTSAKPLEANHKEFKGLQDIDSYIEDGLYKYTYGASENYNETVRIRGSLADSYPDSFIVAFKNGKKMNVNIAVAESKKNSKQ
ncbi:MAG: N-acetylmuramoyl-L-alanine amidase [Mediterranea sp.]|jgi:N-acetylmuramoyl-L-alanine amidase|nr:N-acetylmuramoyl-L-alanine amidase [Mediterranea sp.]